MALTTKNFETLVSEQVAAIQGRSTKLVDLTVGSVLLAFVEAFSGVVLWLQSLILKVLAISRAATSNGEDLDSWMADFDFPRLDADEATGQVTFSRFTATARAVVKVGTTVQISDGSQQYTVTADASYATYSASDGGYVAAAGVASIVVPVIAVTAGAAGNASAGQVNTLVSAVPGFDTVVNAAAFVSGADAESDVAYRKRFKGYIASLSKATPSAVGYSATSLQQGIVAKVIENELYDGTVRLGFFTVIVDDGSGTPPTSLLSSVFAAIDAVRPTTITFGVWPPVVVPVVVSLTITTDATYDRMSVVAAVSAALTSYINATALGTGLAWSRLVQVAYDASVGVTNVSGLLLNGGTADISVTKRQVVKVASVTIA